MQVPIQWNFSSRSIRRPANAEIKIKKQPELIKNRQFRQKFSHLTQNFRFRGKFRNMVVMASMYSQSSCKVLVMYLRRQHNSKNYLLGVPCEVISFDNRHSPELNLRGIQ